MSRVKVQPEVKKIKVLDQFALIKNRQLLNQKDERLKIEVTKNTYLEKTPLKFFAEYINKNILSSVITNTTEDVLGRFYGEFIRYSGGDGQTLGVVLTPKHITELFSELIDLKPSDKIFDPCCGTGGFLIAGMHKMLSEASEDQRDTIKKDQIHGIEIREDMFAIATTNMILRGDGKSNLINDDFLRRSSTELRTNEYTVGFINPPYSQAKGKDTAHLSEISFIKHLLDSLKEGGRCVAIVPQSTMVGKTKEDKLIKKRILEQHTLEGVITLNKNTFYGVGTNPCIAIFTAHKPHSDKKYCKFINYEDDGFVVSKHIGLVETERAKEKKAHLINCWLHDAPAESKFMVKTTIEPGDEWLHSFYYFNDEIPNRIAFERTISDYLTFEFNMIMIGREYIVDRRDGLIELQDIDNLNDKRWQEFIFQEIFSIDSTSSSIDKNKLIMKKGNFPYVTRTDKNNGIDFFVCEQESRYKKDSQNVITIGLDTQTVFYQPYEFYTGQNIQILKSNKLNFWNAHFLIPLIKKQMEKFSWGSNGATLTRLRRSKILLPLNAVNEPDFDYMERYIKKIEFEKLTQYLNRKKE
ncbi:MAG: N-6 DNA methylase [Eubacteriaceae bacterium]